MTITHDAFDLTVQDPMALAPLQSSLVLAPPVMGTPWLWPPPDMEHLDPLAQAPCLSRPGTWGPSQPQLLPPDIGHGLPGHSPLLVTSGGHHWRPVQTCSLEFTVRMPHCTDIWWSLKHVWLASRWYACYWNAFLFFDADSTSSTIEKLFSVVIEEKTHTETGIDLQAQRFRSHIETHFYELLGHSYNRKYLI